jgi:transcriptional repressor NrdR
MEDRVIETRELANGASLRRRRECILCGYRFTSYETVEEKPLMVTKRDGRRQPFERSKLEKGLQRALDKRPVSLTAIENLALEIEAAALMAGKETGEIPSSDLGELVLEKLHALDKVGYVRFASVYRHFENIDEFIGEIQKLKKTH